MLFESRPRQQTSRRSPSDSHDTNVNKEGIINEADQPSHATESNENGFAIERFFKSNYKKQEIAYEEEEKGPKVSKSEKQNEVIPWKRVIDMEPNHQELHQFKVGRENISFPFEPY